MQLRNEEILAEYNPGYKMEDLLALYSFTGGVAKYVQLLIDVGATTKAKAKMLNQIIRADSVFWGERKAILIEKFGKDYGVYFSILSAIATKNVRYTIEDNFFTFWFRFIYKYNYILEIENYESVKAIISRDYETFSGLMLERYFKRVLMKSKLTHASVVGGTAKAKTK